jgi:hypothetical protein
MVTTHDIELHHLSYTERLKLLDFEALKEQCLQYNMFIKYCLVGIVSSLISSVMVLMMLLEGVCVKESCHVVTEMFVKNKKL